jgi:cyanophycinase
MPSPIPQTAERGYIIPIGGAEDKVSDRTILRRFARIAGREDARLVIIPTASRLDDTGPRYETLFRDMGVKNVSVLPLTSRAEADSEAAIETLTDATGVFFTGGNQLRLSTTLGGTKVATTVRRLNARGVHIAGTSAGAAFVSEHMIAFGREGATPYAGQVTLSPGLGLTNRIIVDQHFRQRDRLGRLLTALAYNPFAIGVGLDEDTAAFIGPNNELHVIGNGAITIVDVGDLEFSSMASVDEGDPVQLIGIRLHILTEGGKYHLHERKATPG